jgi:hypothetical protein
MPLGSLKKRPAKVDPTAGRGELLWCGMVPLFMVGKKVLGKAHATVAVEADGISWFC